MGREACGWDLKVGGGGGGGGGGGSGVLRDFVQKQDSGSYVVQSQKGRKTVVGHLERMAY